MLTRDWVEKGCYRDYVLELGLNDSTNYAYLYLRMHPWEFKFVALKLLKLLLISLCTLYLTFKFSSLQLSLPFLLAPINCFASELYFAYYLSKLLWLCLLLKFYSSRWVVLPEFTTLTAAEAGHLLVVVTYVRPFIWGTSRLRVESLLGRIGR